MKKSPLLIIFLTVFIDLIGFGIIIPLSPYFAAKLGATEVEVGVLQASYSLLQFIFAPLWGRLSDKYGRRPIILVCLLGGGLSYVFFAFATQFWMLILARSLAGFFAGNISAASAYIADITPPESRSKNLGLIGAAFGLGFIFGPVLGGLLGEVGNHISSEPPFGMGFSALFAAGLCVANFTFAYFALPESRTLPGAQPKSAVKPNRVLTLTKYLKSPLVGRLMLSFFLSGLAMAHMESMLFLYVKDVFEWSLKQASFGFAFVGVMLVFTQGYLIRKIIPRFGERRVMFAGLTMAAIGIGGIGFSYMFGVWYLALVNMCLALGVGMVNPSILGSISLLVGKDTQGEAMGVTQSLSGFGRILGPVSGGYLYGHIGSSSPFWTGGLLALLGLLILLPKFSMLPEAGKSGAGAH